MSAPALVVDARMLHASGIGRYLREVLPRVVAEGFGEVWLAGRESVLREWSAAVLPGARIVPYDYGVYDWRAQLGYAAVRRAVPAGAVHWFPHWDAPLAVLPRASVVTVHDLIPLEDANTGSAAGRAMMRVALAVLARRAARVLSGSTVTAQALAGRYPAMVPRLRVFDYGGAEFAAVTAGAVPSAAAAPFLLCVGNRKPHKNIALAVRVLAALRASFPSLRLVVVGPQYPSWHDTLALAESLGVAGAVVDLGTPDDAVLRALYGQCAALVAPSRLEGFGLPVVEAMACGAAVIAADRVWARSLGGDAIAYGPVDDPAPWVAQLSVWLQHSDVRRAAGARALVRGAAFTWDRTAVVTAQALREVAPC